MIIRIDNKGKGIKFKSSYSDMNLLELRDYMKGCNDLENVYQAYESLVNQDNKPKNWTDQLDGIIVDLMIIRLDLLHILAKNKKVFKLELDRLVPNPQSIKLIFDEVTKRIGGFDVFWDSCPTVSSFKLSPFSFTSYQACNIETNTVQRDKIASFRLKMAFEYKRELEGNDWDNVIKFIATIIRPKKQQKEIDFNPKAFINQKKMKGYNASQSHAYYMSELNNQIEKQTPIAEKIKANIAVGIIKHYYQKKKNSKINTLLPT